MQQSQNRFRHTLDPVVCILFETNLSCTVPFGEHARARGRDSLAFPQRNPDEFFVLDGELTVEARGPDDYRILSVGERYRVNAQHAHQTSNGGAKDY